MEQIIKEGFCLAGIALKHTTLNANGQSAIDCGNLWQEFEKRDIAAQISGKKGSEVYAVYHGYEGDHTKPYAYFIGCRIPEGAEAPVDLDILNIPAGSYQPLSSTGKMPDCVASSWRQIWNADYPRAYQYDFEVYDERSHDWQNAKVDIFLSVKPV
jgi:predicted transcriptional regulator YdeE